MTCRCFMPPRNHWPTGKVYIATRKFILYRLRQARMAGRAAMLEGAVAGSNKVEVVSCSLLNAGAERGLETR